MWYANGKGATVLRRECRSKGNIGRKLSFAFDDSLISHVGAPSSTVDGACGTLHVGPADADPAPASITTAAHLSPLTTHLVFQEPCDSEKTSPVE